MVVVSAKSNYRHSLGAASEICALVKQRIAIPWLWHYHNLPGDPKPGGRCRSPFYDDNHPDFFISRDGSRFIDWGRTSAQGQRDRLRDAREQMHAGLGNPQITRAGESARKRNAHIARKHAITTAGLSRQRRVAADDIGFSGDRQQA